MVHFAGDATVRVILVRRAHDLMVTLNDDRRAALEDAFTRVGSELQAAAEPVVVQPAWTRRTWPRRRYPQQCYAKTTSGASHFVPFDHAWVELPGNVVFDGVVQTFFTQASYHAVMSAIVVDAYSAVETVQFVEAHRHPGPWNANWAPTPAQIALYANALRA